MKISLPVLTLFIPSIHATGPKLHLGDDSSPIAVFGFLGVSTSDQPGLTDLSRCDVGNPVCDLSDTVGYCNERPSQQGTVIGALQCVKVLRNKRPDKPIALNGTNTQRLVEYTSRDKSLASVTTVLAVRSPNGLGRTISPRIVADMGDAAITWCSRPECKGGRCPMSVVAADQEGNVELWIWGEKDEAEWNPEMKLGPSAGAIGDSKGE